jgi:uncharacterized protein
VVWYLDTSAFLKLITTENNSSAMRKWFSSHDAVWSSQLLHTEALRAGNRLGIDIDIVEDALESVSMVLPSVATFYTAGRLSPMSLRSLDALHLATAMEIGGDLEAFIAYDDRLIGAARASSLRVLTPE